MDGRTWLQYSISVWNDIRKGPEEAALGHPAMFPAELAARLIEIFTTPGDLVIDPFAGVGSTLLAGMRLGRRVLGMELSPLYTSIARERVRRAFQDEAPGTPARMAVPITTPIADPDSFIIKGDALDLGLHLAPGTAALCVTSPPYWNILKQKRTADRKPTRDYGEHPGDLGGIDSYSGYLDSLGLVLEQVGLALRKGGYLALVVMDLRKKDRFYPLHLDICRLVAGQGQGLELDDLIVWDRRQEYNNLRPLGYPWVFRVNRIHEFILLFRKTGTPSG
ncbi:MAG: site-specific DNA-methyltransferase [Firmicutes bacterium]|nr:site-specific DNA-methyltransferase [Bacillota bacterium]